MYRLKKSLGQHFLKDQSVIDRILISLSRCTFSSLLEVGPGGGALTKKLIQLPDIDFKTVEIDEEKVTFLRSEFPSLQVIQEDFLGMAKPFAKPFTIIGNFPYNISSQIIFKIIDWYPSVESVVGMFQKEVAERIVSKPGNKDYGVLSVMTQYYFETVHLFNVGRESFIPPPKVTSSVIRFEKRKELLNVLSENSFKRLVKAAFAHRRKKLRNNLRGIISAEKLGDSMFDRRAETLSVEEFARLTFEIQ